MLSRLAALSAVLFLSAAASAAPRLEALHPAHAWQLAEFRIIDAPTAANNFDPELIRVEATLTAPSGRSLTVPAFWYQEFSRALVAGAEKLTPVGEPHWRVRVTPTETGEHTLTLAIAQAAASARSASAAAASVSTRFEVSAPPPSAAPGWVTIAADKRTFATSDGRPLLFSGHNVCWPGPRGTHDYDQWFAEMAAAKQNFARLWLAPWWAGLEHAPGTLNNYRLDAAWQLDHIFALAEKHGIYLLLCLDHHGMYQSSDAGWGGSNNFWPTNPYSSQQGGPCTHASEFFRDPTAMKLYQKRLRYLIARYGHSPRLVAWQFFNEIDNIFDRAPVDETTVVNWHAQMARWLKANDPYRHVIGTSLTGGVDRPAFWQLPEMEFSSYHSYYEPAPARRLAALVADFTTRYGKPALIGEFGVDAAQWSPSWDPHLRGYRQNLWAGALGGGAATGLSWWWEDVHVDGALEQQTILDAFLRDGGWSEGGWTPLAIEGSLEAPAELGEPLADELPFTTELTLNNFRRLRLDGKFAVASRLAADRASE
ncbi:MAG TPA: cellulase family glycosylhydrolase, partial [Opitutus sp.]|nr:cellulase family glycosylhydrolase [Opitutus sp.]